MTMSATFSTRAFRPPAPPERTKPLSRLGMVYTLWRNPLSIWSKAHFDRDIVLAQTALGPRAAIMDPKAIRHVMLDNVANYRKDELQLNLLRPGLGIGLITAQGEDWKRQRRATAPMFSPRQILEFAPAMHKVARRTVERLAATPRGEPQPMHFQFALATLGVLEETLFSEGLGGGAADFYHALTRYFDTIGRLDPLDLINAPKFIPRLARRRGKGVLSYFGGVVDEIIARRRKLIESGAEPPKDLLTLLLRAADPETGQRVTEADVRANIVTFIGAGHETTGNVLNWTFYLLSQSPEWRAKLEAEIDEKFDPDSDVDPGENLPITRAVAEEAMRLYPPAALMTREAIGEDWLCGQRIEPGTIVLISPYVIHRNRRLWSSPELYDPTRFLGANRDEIDRFQFIPYGAGPRICIGMSFAQQELSILIAHFVKRFRFELAKDCIVTPQLRVTLRPANGLQMIIHRR